METYTSFQLHEQAKFADRWASLTTSCSGYQGTLDKDASPRDIRDLFAYLFKPDGDDIHLACVVANLKPIAQVMGAEDSSQVLGHSAHSGIMSTAIVDWWIAQFCCGIRFYNQPDVEERDTGTTIAYRPEEWARAYLYLQSLTPMKSGIDWDIRRTYLLGYHNVWSAILNAAEHLVFANIDEFSGREITHNHERLAYVRSLDTPTLVALYHAIRNEVLTYPATNLILAH